MDRPALRALWQQVREKVTTGWEEGKALEYLIVRGFEIEGARSSARSPSTRRSSWQAATRSGAAGAEPTIERVPALSGRVSQLSAA